VVRFTDSALAEAHGRDPMGPLGGGHGKIGALTSIALGATRQLLGHSPLTIGTALERTTSNAVPLALGAASTG
jgi:hypothetical protein